MIRYSTYFNNDKQHRKQIADQQVLYDKMSVQLVKLDKHVRDLKNTVLEKDFKISELEECVRNKDLEIEKCLERKDLRPTPYDEKVIGLGYTPMFLALSNEALEIEKFKRSRENKIEFAYDYENLNASYVNEKINLKDDYFQEIINPDFYKIDSMFQQISSLKPYVLNMILEKIIIDLKDEVVNLLEKEKVNLGTIESLKLKGFKSSESVVSESKNQNENDCHKIEKVCDKEENPKVIVPGMFKLNVSQCVSPISMSKLSCDSNNVEIKLKGKRRKRKSSKQNVKQVDNDVLLVLLEDLRIAMLFGRRKGRLILLMLFLGTVRFGNNDFTVIAGYGDMDIGSMTIKKVYYVEGLGHNLFSVGQFCDKGLEVAF
nr:integrase, catalytic region, zinc finger, CCHC-type, peptidase aspartic, catalytic [Tanacetum cinerariifolium]